MQRSKTVILPKLAIVNIKKNGNVYLPYILTLAFMISVFFIFDAISRNELMQKLPYAAYIQMLMMISEVLLGIIIAPFLFYTNSIFMKRRKNELGLYSILGLEKKHIGMMMCIETILIFCASAILGLVTAILFSDVLFGALMKVSGFIVDVSFSITPVSFYTTLSYFAFISGANLFVNLFQISMANPSDLLKTGKKGEKEIKHIIVPTILGILTLGWGYAVALLAKMDSFVFVNFFLAVFLVVIGTYFLITAGSIVFLKKLKKTERIYYHKENFVTISGMLYRMRKNAASIVNICIFATMAMITLICTFSVAFGQEKATHFLFPYDVCFEFKNETENQGLAVKGFLDDSAQLAEQSGVTVLEQTEFVYRDFKADMEGNRLALHDPDSYDSADLDVRLMTISDYNRTEQEHKELKAGEILLYSSIADYGQNTIVLGEQEYSIAEEIKSVRFDHKEPKSFAKRIYYIVMEDEATVCSVADAYQADTKGIRVEYFNIGQDTKANLAFLELLTKKYESLPQYMNSENVFDWDAQMRSMNGGLIFLGVFFSIVFTLCLILVMYYKQIAEGLEDRRNFVIMKQVGMNSEEVRSTIKRQIMLVFFLPLFAALLHTTVSLNMVSKLLSAIHIYDSMLFIKCAAAVAALFLIIYGVSYVLTARTYYKIVNEEQ